VLLGILIGRSADFAYRILTFCDRPFHAVRLSNRLCNSLPGPPSGLTSPTTPTRQRRRAITSHRFGLAPVRSPLLRGSRLFSLPRGSEMFQFPRFPQLGLCVQPSVHAHYHMQVALFGDPRIGACLAAPRGLSQPTTSFVGSWRQGIHRMPFVPWLLRCSRSLWNSQGSTLRDFVYELDPVRRPTKKSPGLRPATASRARGASGRPVGGSFSRFAASVPLSPGDVRPRADA
jgi:hypothetical protein